jgi:hypothetical protein
VRKDPDPDFSFTLEVTVDRNTAGFNLTVRDPVAPEALQTVFAEAYFRSTLGITGTASAMSLAELHSFGHQRHSCSPVLKMKI